MPNVDQGNISNPQTSQGGAKGYPPVPSSANPETRKLIQQQLVLLIHGQQCQRRDKEIAQSGGQVVQVVLVFYVVIFIVLN
jgi:hypothetical protein